MGVCTSADGWMGFSIIERERERRAHTSTSLYPLHTRYFSYVVTRYNFPPTLSRSGPPHDNNNISIPACPNLLMHIF